MKDQFGFLLNSSAETPSSAVELIDKLFDAYDYDDSGFLEGAKYELAVQDFTNHAKAKFTLNPVRLAEAAPDKELLDMWVRKRLDPALSGRIGKDEARSTFWRAFDECYTEVSR